MSKTAIQLPPGTEDDFFFMSNLPPSFTGLPFVVWISQQGYAEHDCWVKVSMGHKVKPGDLVTVTVRPEVREIPSRGILSPEQMQALTRWIELNREVLVRFWDGDIEDTLQVLEQLKPLKPLGKKPWAHLAGDLKGGPQDLSMRKGFLGKKR